MTSKEQIKTQNNVSEELKGNNLFIEENLDEWRRKKEERKPLWTLKQKKEESTYVYVPSVKVSLEPSIFSSIYATDGFITPCRQKEILILKDGKNKDKIKMQPQSAPAKINKSFHEKFDIYYDEETYIEIPETKTNIEIFSLEMNKENMSPMKSKWLSRRKKYRL
ncbi:hypothetical protein PNEG_01480 [Pneumocystis murina B123]|uniref:Uncharacterized protein n=1 Tax=Pneumocystis murina (strain B123) TaxID=1069680 RepID=M7NSG7_PNEMU|nr:hypothetical protein PNEG_01480 [Pneumocystis murina B123]EMR10207.1 hypothetical protein PNEG_01480 [Pneumocystis murina B123]